MDLYERFINYKIVINAIPIVIFIICITGAIILTVKYFKCKNLAKETGKSNWAIRASLSRTWGDSYYTTDLFQGLALGFGITTGFFGFISVFTTETLLKLIFIPEVYMIEYLTNLM